MHVFSSNQCLFYVLFDFICFTMWYVSNCVTYLEHHATTMQMHKGHMNYPESYVTFMSPYRGHVNPQLHQRLIFMSHAAPCTYTSARKSGEV